jgi:gamma-glutamylcyclotransferase (GGCT)/AIG2-like uncharacterized protein YtfP
MNSPVTDRDPTLLFVYGSLQRGECNHGELQGTRFVGEVRTASRYGLCVLGHYPALAVRGARAVAGELYEVDARTLHDLDTFEGAAYRRDWVALADGRRAQAYFLAPAAESRAIPCGHDRWSDVQAFQ